MKKTVREFVRRGSVACGFGPLILAVLYLVLHQNGVIESLSVNEVCIGIFSLSALAFVAGGMNVVYQIERLPLMAVISIHGVVLYVSYLVTYLLNDWLEWGWIPVLVFSAIFFVGFLAIWVVVYVIVKRNTENINQKLKQQQPVADTGNKRRDFEP